MANPLFIFGGAEGDRTPDPKTARITFEIRIRSPPFPFLAFSYPYRSGLSLGFPYFTACCRPLLHTNCTMEQLGSDDRTHASHTGE